MDKELIEHITETLQKHQEPYLNGAWENFLAKEKKKRTAIFWPIWSAAALILIVFGTVLLLNKFDEQTKSIAKQTIVNKNAKQPQLNIDHLKPEKIIEDHPNQIVLQNPNKKPSFNKKLKVSSKNTSSTISGLSAINPNDEIAIANNPKQVIIANGTIAQTDTPMAKTTVAVAMTNTDNYKSADDIKPANKTFEEILENDSKMAEKNAANVKKSNQNKWQPGIFVGPAIGNDNKIKMNYGFSLSYALADKISINSGLAYNALSATESTDAVRPNSLSGKNLESVNADLKGINIPLEIKYKFTDKFYSGIGISALAVLNNKQENSYIANQLQQVNSVSEAGISQNKTFIVAQRITEPTPTAAADLDKYIGFYNFSLGYKQKLSRKTSFAIEPFLRLPMKPVTTENLNLTNGGLRLMFGF